MLTLTGGELRWRAPAGECPSVQAVRAQIDAAGGLGELDVDAVVTAEPTGGWALELTIALEEVSDTRTLRDADCVALAEATVLLVGTRLDLEPPVEPQGPPLPADEIPPARAVPAEPEPRDGTPAPVPSDAPPPRAPSPPRAARPTGLTFAAGAGVSLGSVPFPGVPSELALGHAWPNIRVALRGRVHVGGSQALGDDGSIRIVVGSAGPQVCARPRWRELEFPLCGEFGVGGSRALTRGDARDRAGGWVEAGLGAGLAWFVDPRWALTAHLAGTSPLVGSRYALSGSSLWDPSPVAGRVMLGVEFFVPIQIGDRPEKSQ